MERDRTDDATPADEGELDPRSAAALLHQATRRAHRQFDRRPPLLMLPGAVLFPVASGAVSWSVRDQHPYAGPAGWALAVLYAIVAVWVVAVTTGSRSTCSRARCTTHHRRVGGRDPFGGS